MSDASGLRPFTEGDFGRLPVPSAKTVSHFHRGADTDRGDRALHHTLGLRPGQAARGTDMKKALADIDAVLAPAAENVTLTIGVSGIQPKLRRVGNTRYLEGRIDNGSGLTLSTTAQTVWTLAAGDRPLGSRNFVVNGGGNTALKLTIGTAGVVQVSIITGTPTQFYLDGVVWFVD